MIHYLSVNLLLSNQPEGDIVQTSSVSSPSPRHCLRFNSLQPSEMFYRLPELLRNAIQRELFLAANNGEEKMKSLINSYYRILNDPAVIVSQNIPLSVSKVDSHVHFPNAAMTVVSFKENVNNLNTGFVLHFSSRCGILFLYLFL